MVSCGGDGIQADSGKEQNSSEVLLEKLLENTEVVEKRDAALQHPKSAGM